MASSTDEASTESPNKNENTHSDSDVDMIDVVSAVDSEHNHNNKYVNKQVAHEDNAIPEDPYETNNSTLIRKAVKHNESESKTEESTKGKHLTRLPLSRIKYIMKADEDCSIISQDAVFLVTKATEMFIESIAKETMKFTSSTTGKRKIISKKEVDSVIDSVPYLCFLDGIFE